MSADNGAEIGHFLLPLQCIANGEQRRNGDGGKLSLNEGIEVFHVYGLAKVKGRGACGRPKEVFFFSLLVRHGAFTKDMGSYSMQMDSFIPSVVALHGDRRLYRSVCNRYLEAVYGCVKSGGEKPTSSAEELHPEYNPTVYTHIIRTNGVRDARRSANAPILTLPNQEGTGPKQSSTLVIA